MTIAETKALERKAAFARRQRAFETLPDAPQRTADAFMAAFEPAAGQMVAAYRPIRTELDPTPLLKALHERGVRLCVPVVVGKGLALVFRRWTPDSAMETHDFGVQIPVDKVETTPELIIAPMVAWDRRGTRLGYGGGFYDRTVARLKVPFIGYAFMAQEAERLPRDATDIPLDAVVTEEGVVRFNA